jgi:hypothetical protein
MMMMIENEYEMNKTNLKVQVHGDEGFQSSIRFNITIEFIESDTPSGFRSKDLNPATLAPHLLWLSTVS